METNNMKLAGNEWIAPPVYHANRNEWERVINGSAYWFTKAAMRWFGCRVYWDTLTEYRGGYLFISSEQDAGGAWNGQRRYTLRHYTDARGVHTLGKFMQHATLAAARRELRITTLADTALNQLTN